MGTVFSIEEFSVYDGPGVRMSVFLKGCPLKCEWCHNPEGQRFEKEYIKGDNGCLKCGKCFEEGRKLSDKPSLCERSIAVCPRHLVRECGVDYTPEKLCAKLLKNSGVLASMGGGVTFSGGEPLAQAGFLVDCLKLLEGKMHRAVQTCGMADEETFKTVLSDVEYVLYDLKLMDNDLHKKYTGCGNEKILSNYKSLARSKIDFITRIPLIPTVNDTESNITQTAEFMHSLDVKKIELLPYNKLAGSKYSSVGRKYEPSFDEKITPCPRTEIWKKYGIEVRVL